MLSFQKKDTSIHKRLSFNSGNEKYTTNEPMEPIRTNKHLSIASVQSSSGFSSVGSSVEGLFTKEDVSSENKSFKFDEILHIINLETDEKETVSKPQSDLELFENKVSKWQKFGFGQEKCPNVADRAFTSVNLEPRRTLFRGSATSRQIGVASVDSSATISCSGSKKFSSLIDSSKSLSPAIIALQLEVRIPVFYIEDYFLNIDHAMYFSL